MIPFILSGGRGTRLWPISRTTYPKPFCHFFDQPLMVKTIQRLSPLGVPRVIAIEDQRSMTVKTSREYKFNLKSYFEPFGRNTSASVALACAILEQEGLSESVMGVFPSDHLVENEKMFQNALRLAEERAQAGHVVTLGIHPKHPATGYGYIEVAQEVAKGHEHKSFQARGFREKPDRATAEKFLNDGNYFWNAGIFVFKASIMIENFRKHMPDLWEMISQIRPDLSNLNAIYENAPAKSIDYGIMEKLKGDFECVPCDVGWNDVGSWSEIAQLLEERQPEHVQLNARNNFVHTIDKNKTVALIDVENLVIVDSGDALLITNRDSSQKVSQIVQKLDEIKPKVTHEHSFEERPWGQFEVLRDEQQYKVKVIRIDGGQQISYQSHAKRGEHWIVVEGAGIVVLDEKELQVKKGEHIFIPQGARHRMKNTSQQSVIFVEVQVGSYFGEDDIVRYKDDYGRAT